MKYCKYAICLLLLCMIGIWLLPSEGHATGQVEGSDFTWRLEDGCLTISGTGPMPENFPRWNEFPGEITTVVIEPGVTTVGSGVFEDCETLTHISLPDSIVKIDDWAFLFCSDLKQVQLPAQLQYIGFGAFYYCTELTSITIPPTVNHIEPSAFDGCSKLTEIHISDIAAWTQIQFPDRAANPLTPDRNLYLNGQLVTDLVLPEGITEVNAFAFSNCTSLQTVTLPEGVTRIQTEAFYNCSNLTTVNLPNSLEQIGDQAFSHCTALTAVDLPNSLEQIGNQAFSHCTALTSVTLPDTLTDIQDYAFGSCTSLKSVTMSPSVTHLGRDAFINCTQLDAVYISDLTAWLQIDFDYHTSNPLYYAGKLYVDGQLLTHLVLPEGLTEVNAFAFTNYAGLQTVTLPEGVTHIQRNAFTNCANLTTVYLPNSLERIGYHAFLGCNQLNYVQFTGNYMRQNDIDIDGGNQAITKLEWAYEASNSALLSTYFTVLFVMLGGFFVLYWLLSSLLPIILVLRERKRTQSVR